MQQERSLQAHIVRQIPTNRYKMNKNPLNSPHRLSTFLSFSCLCMLK